MAASLFRKISAPISKTRKLWRSLGSGFASLAARKVES